MRRTTKTLPLPGIDARLAAYATLAGVALAAPAVTKADIVYSGPVNITIPDNIDGIYMNIVTGVFSSSAALAPGWDINPYSREGGLFNLWGPTEETWFSASGYKGGPFNLTLGTVIGGPATNFFRPGGPIDVGLQVNLNSANNYLGFQFVNENGGGTHYGWVQLQFGATAGSRSIVGYGWDNIAGRSIAAGAVPEPSTTVLLGVIAAGAFGLRAWRKRKAA